MSVTEEIQERLELHLRGIVSATVCAIGEDRTLEILSDLRDGLNENLGLSERDSGDDKAARRIRSRPYLKFLPIFRKTSRRDR